MAISESTGARALEAQGPPLRVLMVDDEQLLLNVYRRNLELEFDITTAISGVEALEVVGSQGPFPVIVTDQRMPGMDGIEFISKVRELNDRAVFVMLTGTEGDLLPNPSDQTDIFRLLCKPCPTAEIKAAILDAHRCYLTAGDELIAASKSAEEVAVS